MFGLYNYLFTFAFFVGFGHISRSNERIAKTRTFI
jgi:hypothetical protein